MDVPRWQAAAILIVLVFFPGVLDWVSDSSPIGWSTASTTCSRRPPRQCRSGSTNRSNIGQWGADPRTGSPHALIEALASKVMTSMSPFDFEVATLGSVPKPLEDIEVLGCQACARGSLGAHEATCDPRHVALGSVRCGTGGCSRRYSAGYDDRHDCPHRPRAVSCQRHCLVHASRCDGDDHCHRDRHHLGDHSQHPDQHRGAVQSDPDRSDSVPDHRGWRHRHH